MNWGKGIIGGMILFMLFIISMCVYMFGLPADEYDHQYYEKGLNFDRDQAREIQVVKDRAQPNISYDAHVMRLIFTRPATGKITFIRPSDQYQDRVFKIDTHASPGIDLPISSIEKGKWRLVMEWDSDHKAYLYQQDIFIK